MDQLQGLGFIKTFVNALTVLNGNIYNAFKSFFDGLFAQN